MTSRSPILFQNATIIDGSGTTPRYIASVLTQDSIIKSISTSPIPPSTLPQNTRIIDSSGYILSPGFIDLHAHSDLSLLHTPEHLAKITQGVTTEVIGQDGIAYAPVSDEILPRIREQIAGWNGNPTDEAFWRWRSVREYLDVLDESGIATNAAFLVPQGNLRALVKGWHAGEATQVEIEQMRGILRNAMEEGAVGMSSGLTYVPGMFASTSELEQLCQVVKEYGGYYCPHTRSYGKGALEAYGEMIEIAKRTGVRLHLTHATMNYEENEGRAGEFLKMVDKAIEDGVDVTLDTYPYTPGSTTLVAMLPSWAASTEDRYALLEDPDMVARIKHEAIVTGTDGCHGCPLPFDKIEISGVANPALTDKYVGKSIQQIAQEQKQDPFDMFLLILKEDNFNSTILMHIGHESNVRDIMRHRKHTGGSDGILTSTRPHPRGWGTFPRYLGHYARDLPQGLERDLYDGDGVDSMGKVEAQTIFDGGLEEAVAHLTSRSAAVIGMKDRGLVKEGFKADLLLFNEEEIQDVATYAKPRAPARGIRSVLVRGILAINEGTPTTARAGKTIRLKKEGQWVAQ